MTNRVFTQCPECGRTRDEEGNLCNLPKFSTVLAPYDIIEEVCFDCDNLEEGEENLFGE